MKNRVTAMMIVACLLMLTGCASAMETTQNNSRSVKVQEVVVEMGKERVEYIGIVDSKDMVKYSFKTPGKIEKVYVEKGQEISAGDPLAKLDEQELSFALDAANASLKAAEYQVVQAREAYNYDKDNLKKMKALLEGSAISQDVYNQLTLKTKVSEETYKQALQKVEGLKSDAAYKLFLKEHATIVADTDGLVVEVLYEENEQVAAYYPVVVIRSVDQIVNVGIAQKDVDKLTVGIPATIDFYGHVATGRITQVADAPDSDTRTYNGEVTLTQSNYKLGAITKVTFDVGDIRGIWVPVNAILSDGEDYVYVVKDGRAFKRIVTIEQINNGKMMVEGLEVGELVVVNGMGNLLDGMAVNISEE
ncbi:MAG: efflux RND transporter periplasmic adaptor subunit [Clostridia bacterium]|nr:efflux RND transporter periplasmic adaptor subunit [Clostridia bacterium]